MNKNQIRDSLIESYNNAISAGDVDECALQFTKWLKHVETVLMAAKMNDELQYWNKAADNIEFVPDESSFPAHAEAMKSLLLTIFSDAGTNIIDLDRIKMIKELTTNDRSTQK